MFCILSLWNRNNRPYHPDLAKGLAAISNGGVSRRKAGQSHGVRSRTAGKPDVYSPWNKAKRSGILL